MKKCSVFLMSVALLSHMIQMFAAQLLLWFLFTIQPWFISSLSSYFSYQNLCLVFLVISTFICAIYHLHRTVKDTYVLTEKESMTHYNYNVDVENSFFHN